MPDAGFVGIGRVVKTHGLTGEVSVATAAGASLDPLAGVDVWFTPPPASVRCARIRSTRSGPKGPLLSFDTITSIDEARTLVGTEMLVKATDLPAGWGADMIAEEPDLDGYEVYDARHGVLGTVVETLITGANDVWVVHGSLGEVLIPVIDDVVIGVDDDTRTIEVRLLDGLLAEEGEMR